jgi:phosphoribosylglycinamide formyltransferase-1
VIERWAIFFSGRGSNLNKAIHFSDQRIVLGLTNKKNSLGRFRLKRAGIPCVVMDAPIDWAKVDSVLRQNKITKIFLLGFMRLLPGTFLKRWQEKIFNVHPSLLPLYPGTHSFDRSFEDHKDVGVSVHHVIEQMDCGKIILQKKILDASQSQWPSKEQAQLLLSATEQRLVERSMSFYGGLKKWN